MSFGQSLGNFLPSASSSTLNNNNGAFGSNSGLLGGQAHNMMSSPMITSMPSHTPSFLQQSYGGGQPFGPPSGGLGGVGGTVDDSSAGHNYFMGSGPGASPGLGNGGLGNGPF